jgi:acetoin utilization protein AcuC
MPARRTAFLYTDAFLAYDLGPRHPLQQKRLRMVHQLLAAYGLFAPDGPVDWIEPAPATEEALAEVHTPDYLEAVRRAGGEAPVSKSYLEQYGLGPGDTPAFRGMYEAAALYAGGTVDAARLVMQGGYDIAFNVAGGLHHAHPDHASGFCTFSDNAMGAHELLRNGCRRVAYIDIDAHHGDGVQACFYDDPRVLTISIHEGYGRFFPGTGYPDEIGEGAGAGTSLNIPLFPYTGDDTWHEAFDAVIPSALERFAPDGYVLQVGADAHFGDPLAHLMMTSRGWMRAFHKLLALGEGKPIVVTGGGGYNIRTVTRLWAMVQAACAGVELPDEVPASFDGMYNVPRLHDTELPDPVADDVRTQARDYARAQVARLNELRGEYGVA